MFHVKLAKFLQTSTLNNIYEQLLLDIVARKSYKKNLQKNLVVELLFSELVVNWISIVVVNLSFLDFAFCSFFSSFPHFPDSKVQKEME